MESRETVEQEMRRVLCDAIAAQIDARFKTVAAAARKAEVNNTMLGQVVNQRESSKMSIQWLVRVADVLGVHMEFSAVPDKPVFES